MELFNYLNASSLAPSTLPPMGIIENVTVSRGISGKFQNIYLIFFIPKCGFVNNLPTYEAQCDFVLNNGSCGYDGIIYSYTTLTYCQLGHIRPVALLVLLLILLMLFVAIGSVADDL